MHMCTEIKKKHQLDFVRLTYLERNNQEKIKEKIKEKSRKSIKKNQEKIKKQE